MSPTQGPDPNTADETRPDASAPSEPSETVDAGRRPPPRPEETLRALFASGRSQVGILGALRARDVSRPRAEHIAAAERRDRQG
ncbi:MAG: hypothetical protein IRZ02_05590 [Acidothermus sp.]|nr:hypothetical protein [Acidothermus sp.]MCL6537960.1 hypothetical protein [Acidothermus sp.]